MIRGDGIGTTTNELQPYKLTIEFERDLEDNMTKREAMKNAYALSIRIRISW